MRIHNGMLVKKTEKRHEMPINVKDLQLTSDLSTSVPQLKPKQSAKTVSNEYVSETGIYQPTDNAKAIQQMVAIIQHPYHQPSIFNRPSFSRNFMIICCIVME